MEMTMRIPLMAALVGSSALAVEPQPAQRPPGAAETKEAVVEPKADAQLRKMSDYLAGLQRFKFDSTTVDEKVSTDGQKIQELQQSRITVQRPSELRVDRVGPNGHVLFVYDGKRFGVYNRDKNAYATAPAPGQMDAAIDEARARLHIDAPGGDLLVSDAYHALIDGTVTGRYIGLEPIEGVMAHHLAFTKKDVDWQIWIEDGPEPLPLRYVITSKDIKAQPQFTIEMRDWRPNASVPPDSFAFTPPPGAKRVEFAPPRKTEPPGGQP
jgi:hypothetical protein